MKIKTYKCKLCGHEWISKLDNKLPILCPRCKRPDWNGKIEMIKNKIKNESTKC